MTDLGDTLMKEKLEALVLEDSDFRKLEQALSVYCPFEALGVERAEIRHANFLASMLDPYRPHGFGDKFLRALIDTLLARSGASQKFSRLRLHLMDLDNVEVRREWRSIDLLVTLAEQRLVLVFELKIDALESKGQLERYREAVEARWPTAGGEWAHLYFFLTPDGAEPSDPVWRAISYDEVIEAIEAVLSVAAADRLAVSMLRAYAAMLRRNVMQDEELAAIAQALWQRHREALEYLTEQRPDELGSLGEAIKERADEIGRAVSTQAIRLIQDDSLRTMTRFAVEQWETLPGIKSGAGWTTTKRILLVEIKAVVDHVQVMLILGPGEKEFREAYFKAAQPEIKRGAKRLTDKWKTLASSELLGKGELKSEFDQERCIALLKERLGVFVKETLPKFDECFRAIGWDSRS